MSEMSARRRRRNLLLLAGLVPSFVALVVAGVLLVMLVRNSLGLDATARGQHEAARWYFAANRWPGTVERWVAPYNEGVAALREDLLDDAMADFRAALELAPEREECRVLHNIAVVLERGGDAAAADDERRAVDLYRRGREALADGHCVERVGDEAGAVTVRARELDARLSQKIRALLGRQDRAALAGLTLAERARSDRSDKADERAAELEQRLQDAEPEGPEPPPSSRDPEDPDGPDDSDEGGEVEYGW